MSGLAYLKRGSMKYFPIHIFIIFRIHQLILNSRFLVSSILDLAYPLEACVVKDWTCEKCHVRSATLLLCEQIPTDHNFDISLHFGETVRHEDILRCKLSQFQIKLCFLVGTSNEYSFRLTTFAPLIYGDRSRLPRRVRGSMKR